MKSRPVGVTAQWDAWLMILIGLLCRGLVTMTYHLELTPHRRPDVVGKGSTTGQKYSPKERGVLTQ